MALPISTKAAAILNNLLHHDARGGSATEQLFLKAAVALSAAQRETVFKDLAHSLSELLDADIVLIGVLHKGVPEIDALALWADGHWVRDFHYPLAGTPCATVIGREFRFYPQDVDKHFDSPEFRGARVGGYAGFPLTGTHGEALGLIAVMTHGALQHAERIEALLRLFSDRVVVEIERARSDAQRKAAEDERLTLEAQLRHAQRMETVGQLAGGIAHDFNNILTGLLGYVEMAKEHVESLADAKLSRYLDRAHRSGLRARNLVQQLLTFSRGHRGQPRAVQLAKVTRDMMGLLESTLPSSLLVQRDIPETLPIIVLDPLHFEQVLLNLCINSRDAMEGVGTLNIALSRRQDRELRCCASCRQPFAGDFVELAISDSGPGIPPDVQQRMFEPFFSTKESAKGTGMGLAIVHGIVHEYDGHLIVDSPPGGGTTFRVLLPCPPERAVDTLAGHAQPTAAGEILQLQGRAFCVDDNPEVGEFMQELLEGWGLSVVRFENPVAALAAFEAAPAEHDFALLDQTMPGLTGLALARALLARRPDLPVLLYTGYSDQLTEDSAREAGVRALLKKPLDLAHLRSLLADLLQCRIATIR